ncbi:MAG TPA: bifunctional alpha,alpha-trehalose-phosphate synthase (UDP-forming)/trehalose-phosphatase [Spirochaetota bacterium]|nr:bifunctional alpha,alpha-trehalose-phosphate synthase (UDP-forming)/trehalose-phosphatase [Spirochaetota bacterium]HPV42256.1 bifunctional alpha,alpha-trehalose-phosphate synthase (UDP-forming)/trehalose-phosphatase [Spirochaetota bacterium]
MSKIILAANRLPVTVEIKKNGEPAFSPSVGGLATGMSSLSKTYSCLWAGYSGIPIESIAQDKSDQIRNVLIDKYKAYPVPLTDQDIELYYNGFANKTIWPLFHYFPYFTSFNEETWKAYVEVNSKFYSTLKNLYEPGDIVWVHDYHLMLLPGIIRQNIPDATIGFFLHIPFPSYEVFRLLPWRKEILTGLMGSDLIGFHTFGYVRHFLSSVQRLIGIDHSMGQMNVENRTVKCDTFPMGIDYQRYSDYMHNKKIVREITGFKDSMTGKKLILSMDRLDFTKGIIERLNSFERFLEKYPEYHGKVQMIIVTVPSRTQVDTYIKLRKTINEHVGRINGKYNTLSWSPIQYLYRSLPFEMIMTLYHCSDVCLVTPLRDGMNLVAKEYVAARINNDGVLILSEMAGVSEELGEALIVNPNNKEEVADAIATALSMPEDEKHRRMQIMQRRLQRNDVIQWSSSFIEKLSNMKIIEEAYKAKSINSNNLHSLLDAYRGSRSRLLLLDYDGTLVAFSDKPDMAVPDPELLSILSELTSDIKNTVAIISGRNFEFLERHFSGMRLSLIAEHGAWIKLNGGEWKTIANLDTQWKNEIRPILESYCDRTPRTFIEEKEFSLAWHYRRADAELASIRAMELKGNLLHMIANHNLGIMEGNKVLEIKSLEINKGKIASFMLSAKEYDFTLAIGDDVTDEDLFSALPDNGFSVKVGFGPSKAKYYITRPGMVRQLLGEFGKAH